MNAYRRIRLGGFLLAHLPKEGSEEAPFGSQFWNAQARATWLVKKQHEVAATSFTLGLFNKKSNHDRPLAPLGFEVSFSGARVRFERRDVRDVPALAASLPVAYRMRSLLGQRGAMFYGDIARELGASYEAVKKAAERGAREKGPFVLIDGGDERKKVALRSAAREEAS